jgi:class 3 adenylate cyclase
VAGQACILIVDDEPFNVDVLEQELELLNYDTLSASNGHEALALLSREQVDLLLLDVMMPQLDGFGVLASIRGQPALRHLPVIMISALNEMGSVVRCIELGAEDYLPKPFEPVLLKARIGACLEKKRLHDTELAYLQRIEAQMREIEVERERADALLHVILPAPAVAELKATDRVAPRRHEEVTVMFADVVGFTPYCDQYPPEEVVTNLQLLVEGFEEIASAHGLEKIKTAGDAFMAAAGLLVPNDDPVMASVRCAFAMAEAAVRAPPAWQLRVGIHIGPVVAGVVGRQKFAYDLWGDTINVAARLSEFGSAGSINLSGEAWSRVVGRCQGRHLGPVALKGKRGVEVVECIGFSK